MTVTKQSKAFERIKNFYKDGRWNESRVKDALNQKLITKKEYNQIIK